MARELSDASTADENVNEARQNASETMNSQEFSIAVQDSWRSPGKPGDADNEISAPATCRPELGFPSLQIDGNVKSEKGFNSERIKSAANPNSTDQSNNIAGGIKTPKLECFPPGFPRIQLEDSPQSANEAAIAERGQARQSAVRESGEPNETVAEEIAQFWDILKKDPSNDFGSQETREAIKDLFEKAKANGTMDSVIHSLENTMMGRGAYAIRYDNETGELCLLSRQPAPADGFPTDFEKIDSINLGDKSGKGKDSPEYKELISGLEEAKKNGTLDTYFDDPENREKLKDLIYGWFRSGEDGRALDALNSDLEKMGTDQRFEVKRKLFEGDIMLMTVWFGGKEVMDGLH